ncbi:outer envelope pore protein 16-1, chloroplastic-like [Triticum dicoccoides]|uniref:outer envelope pore protein 16-1, chloroplastic-like n=1 Tax=Triticum dicoccoides TaxID=85692 RepID=UPI001890558A|nr:outer envelope pore protein 16-1, chloroplastic-like [Triticum dicoccoides]
MAPPQAPPSDLSSSPATPWRRAAVCCRPRSPSPGGATAVHVVIVIVLQLMKMCKEGAYWGAVAGVYVGMEYGVERVRGVYDWMRQLKGEVDIFSRADGSALFEMGNTRVIAAVYSP